MQEVSGQTKGQNPLLMDHPEDEPFQKAKANTFVGCKAVSAAEYHDADFTWEEHRDRLHLLNSSQSRDLADSSECKEPEKGCQDIQLSSWEAMHARDNASGKFYKERRYLLLEFPCLLKDYPPQHILEIGCGCGSSILPVLKANSNCRATAIDLSPTAIALLQKAARAEGIAEERISAGATDCTDALANQRFAGLEVDAVLLIFTLGALFPNQMPPMLQIAFKAMARGGLLLIRDHGLLDMTHLRIREHQRLGHRLYRRGDGTSCYFFSRDDLQQRVEAAGFVTLECKYACVCLSNQKTKLEMRRVFVHGIFQKP